MAESYAVQAILSVKDHMSAALKGAASAADSLNGGFKRTIGATGEVTVSEEQQEVAAYVFADTQKTGA